MTTTPEPSDLGLVDFLDSLRAELEEAATKAERSRLKLGVEEISVSLTVAVTKSRTAEGSAKVRAKFWVVDFGEAGAKGSMSSDRVATQQLTLTLRPRLDAEVAGGDGAPDIALRGLDVAGELQEDEERAQRPRPREHTGG